AVAQPHTELSLAVPVAGTRDPVANARALAATDVVRDVRAAIPRRIPEHVPGLEVHVHRYVVDQEVSLRQAEFADPLNLMGGSDGVVGRQACDRKEEAR